MYRKTKEREHKTHELYIKRHKMERIMKTNGTSIKTDKQNEKEMKRMNTRQKGNGKRNIEARKPQPKSTTAIPTK